MKVNSIEGKPMHDITLPEQFKEELRKDLIRRVYNALRSHEVQAKGAMIGAGMRHSDFIRKRRHVFKSVFGHGRSRSPRKVMSRNGQQFAYIGAKAPFTRGGRRAFPPVSAKVIEEKVNVKERRKAIRSALSATKIIIMEDKFEKLNKTKELIKTLQNNGVNHEAKKRLKKGVARLRGRMTSYSKGPLIVVSGKCNIEKIKSIPGVDIAKVNELNVKLLAPGSNPGRITLMSEAAVKKMHEAKLYL